jgi:hypothetical protein
MAPLQTFVPLTERSAPSVFGPGPVMVAFFVLGIVAVPSTSTAAPLDTVHPVVVPTAPRPAAFATRKYPAVTAPVVASDAFVPTSDRRLLLPPTGEPPTESVVPAVVVVQLPGNVSLAVLPLRKLIVRAALSVVLPALRVRSPDPPQVKLAFSAFAPVCASVAPVVESSVPVEAAVNVELVEPAELLLLSVRLPAVQLTAVTPVALLPERTSVPAPDFVSVPVVPLKSKPRESVLAATFHDPGAADHDEPLGPRVKLLEPVNVTAVPPVRV